MGDARTGQQAFCRLISFNQSIQFMEGGTSSRFSLCHISFPDITKYHRSARLCSNVSELSVQDSCLDQYIASRSDGIIKTSSIASDTALQMCVPG
jgi:hypothetical protein